MAETKCSVDGCEGPHLARGWCNKHYLRWRIHGSPTAGGEERSRAPAAERFWSWVEIGGADECWPSRGWRRGGSGHVGFRAYGRDHYAHRFAWELTYGAIPAGMEVCHHCDNPPCCNPAHLFIGTHQDNMTDMKLKGRQPGSPQPGEANPQAKLTREQVEVIRRAYAAREGTHAAIAERFGVSRQLVGLIVNHKIWT